MTPRIDTNTSNPKQQKLPELPIPPENLSSLFPEPAEASGAPIGDVELLTAHSANDLTKLFQETLLVEESSDLVLDLTQYDPRTFTIRILQDNGMLTEENRTMVMDHKDPQSLCSAVADLFAMEIFDHDLFSILSKRSNPNFITQTLLQFQQVHGLTEETFKFVLKHSDPQLLYSLIDILRGLGRFTINDFYQCAAHPMVASLAAYLSLLIETNLPVEKYYDLAFKEINLTYLVQVMKILKSVGILTDENIALATGNPELPHSLLSVLERLIEKDLMNEVNYQAAIKSRNFRSLSAALYLFEDLGMLNQTTYRLIVNLPNHWSLITVVNTLSTGNLLTEANLQAAATHKTSDSFAQAIVLLNDHHLLTPESYELILGHESPKEFAEAIISLHEHEILTDEHRDLAAQHKHPTKLVEGIVLLAERRCLTKENLDRVFQHINPNDCAAFLAFLSSNKPKAKETFLKDDFEMILGSAVPLAITQAWGVLNDAGILTAENKTRVLSHEANYYSMAIGLTKLHQCNLLNDENIDLIKHSYHPHETAEMLVTMQETNLLNEENRKRIHHFSLWLCIAIKNLHYKKLLDQEAFEWISSENVEERCKIISEIWFMDAEIFSIFRNHDQPKKLAEALILLKGNNVPIKEHLQSLTTHKSPYDLANGFVGLKNSNLPKECYEWLAKVEGKPSAAASLYCQLHAANQITEQNLKIVAQCENHGLRDGVAILLENDLFHEENFQAAADHPNPSSFCSALKLLKKQNISIDEYRTLIHKHKYPEKLASILCNLNEAGLLTPERAQQAAQHSSPDHLSGLSLHLTWSKLLSAEAWEEGIVHPHPYEYSQIICTIRAKKIVTDETRSLVAKHPDTLKLRQAVDELGQIHKLTLENFLLIVERPDPVDALALLS